MRSKNLRIATFFTVEEEKIIKALAVGLVELDLQKQSVRIINVRASIT